MHNLAIKTLTTATLEHWDRFVMASPEATFFHRAGWQRVIEESFGHQTYFLYAEEKNHITGILPLGHVKSRVFGNALISLPFCVYGGVVAADDRARYALIDSACRLADSLNVDYLELRHQQRYCPEWPVKDDLYVTFRKPIAADEDSNMKAIPRKQRAMVRKGIQAGLAARIDTGVERFFRAYSESVRNLGTPVLPKRYFRTLKNVFKEDCEILVIDKDDELVAGVMSFYFRDQILPYYGGGVSQARQLKGNDFMYWDVMRRAAARGVGLFDYGRSKKGTGSYSFKKNWGFEPEPLFYEYYLVKARAVPDINPLNPKYRLFIQLWQRLPLPLSQWLGPAIARSLG